MKNREDWHIYLRNQPRIEVFERPLFPDTAEEILGIIRRSDQGQKISSDDFFTDNERNVSYASAEVERHRELIPVTGPRPRGQVYMWTPEGLAIPSYSLGSHDILPANSGRFDTEALHADEARLRVFPYTKKIERIDFDRGYPDYQELTTSDERNFISKALHQIRDVPDPHLVESLNKLLALRSLSSTVMSESQFPLIMGQDTDLDERVLVVGQPMLKDERVLVPVVVCSRY